MTEVTNEKPVIKFTDLRVYLLNRRVPLRSDVIALNTQYFGKSVGLETVRRFLRGDGSPTAISFPVIRDTIEWSQKITIDFSGSAYESLLPAATEAQ